MATSKILYMLQGVQVSELPSALLYHKCYDIHAGPAVSLLNINTCFEIDHEALCIHK